MGKVTGFMEYERVEEGYEPVPQRVQELQGVRHRAERRRGQGPERALHGLRHAVLQQRLPGQQHHSGLQRPGLSRRLEAARSRCCTRPTTSPSSPAASARRRARRRARSTSTTIRSASSRSSTRSSTAPGPRAGSCRSRRRRRPARRSPWSAPARPAWPRRSSWRAPATTVTVFEKNDRDRRPAALRHSRLQDGEVAHRPARRADGGRGRGLPHRRAGRRRCPRAARSPTGAKRDDQRRAAAGASSTRSLLAGGAEQSRDLPVPGRDLDGVHFAMEFLPQQNKVNAGDKVKGQIRADGKHVIVIGGGDTGSDCVGTSNRHGAESVTQFELLPMPPEQENKPLVWPYWPTKLRTSSSHEEGCEREFAIATKEFIGEQGGKVKALKAVRVEWQGGKMVEVPGTEQMHAGRPGAAGDGLRQPGGERARGVRRRARRARQRARRTTEADGGYRPTSTRCSPPATCAAASRWSSGRSARAARPRARSTSS